MNTHNILCANQYGFRKGHSTSLAVVDLYDRISEAIDKKEYAVGIFLDLSKAFDTVDHDILFEKLEYHGVHGIALSWHGQKCETCACLVQRLLEGYLV